MQELISILYNLMRILYNSAKHELNCCTIGQLKKLVNQLEVFLIDWFSIFANCRNLT